VKHYSSSRLWTSNKKYFTRADGLHSLLELFKKWFVECDFVAGNPGNDKAYVEFGKILLVLKAAINRYEDVKLLFGSR